MYKQLLSCLLALLFLSGSVFGAITDKIRGIVIDEGTNDLISDVNVISDSTMNATVSITSESIIQTNPVGSYTLKVGFAGYRDIYCYNIRLFTGLTTQVDLALPGEVFEGLDAIEPEWSLVENNATCENHPADAPKLEMLPIYGVSGALDAVNVFFFPELDTVSGYIVPEGNLAGWTFIDNFNSILNRFQIKLISTDNTPRDQLGSTEPTSLLMIRLQNRFVKNRHYHAYNNLSNLINPTTNNILKLNFSDSNLKREPFPLPHIRWVDWLKWDTLVFYPAVSGKANLNAQCSLAKGHYPCVTV